MKCKYLLKHASIDTRAITTSASFSQMEIKKQTEFTLR